MKKHHDCKEIADQVILLLDGELNVKEEQNVLCELQRCMHCLDEYNLNKRFKEFLCDRVQKKSMPSECRDKITAQINKLK